MEFTSNRLPYKLLHLLIDKRQLYYVQERSNYVSQYLFRRLIWQETIKKIYHTLPKLFQPLSKSEIISKFWLLAINKVNLAALTIEKNLRIPPAVLDFSEKNYTLLRQIVNRHKLFWPYLSHLGVLSYSLCYMIYKVEITNKKVIYCTNQSQLCFPITFHSRQVLCKRQKL